MYTKHHHIIDICQLFFRAELEISVSVCRLPFTCERMKGNLAFQYHSIMATQSIGFQLSELSGAPRSSCVLFPLSHPSPRFASVPVHCANEK